MISEWMKVMLEEISRKNAEAQQARVEEQRRAGGEPVADAKSGGGDEPLRRDAQPRGNEQPRGSEQPHAAEQRDRVPAEPLTGTDRARG